MKKFWFSMILLVSIFALPWFSYDLDDEFDDFLDYESYNDRPSYVPWEFIIKYKSPSNTRWTKSTISVEDVEAELQSSLDDDQELNVIDTIPNFNMAVVSVEWNQNTQDIIKALESNDNIEYAQPNYIYYVESIDTNDPWADFLRWLDNEWQEVNGVVWTAWEDIDRVKMWNTFSGSLSSSGPGSVVWVIDMWINYNHEDLKDQMRTDWNWYHWYDFVHDDNDPMPQAIDSHWTHVAGTIAAKMNNWKWMIWVNPNVKIASLMAWQGGSLWTNYIINALDYAIEHRIKILNASYWWYVYDQSVYEAYSRFRDSWWIFVAAAWNKWIDIDETPHYPSGYELDNIISVTATQSDGSRRYNFWATTVDVWAPWVRIYSANVDSNYNPFYYIDFSKVTFDEMENSGFIFSSWKESFGRTSTANSLRLYSETPNWAYLESPDIDISSFHWDNVIYLVVNLACGNSDEDSDYISIEVDKWDGSGYNKVVDLWAGSYSSSNKLWCINSNTLKYRFVFHKDEGSNFSCWISSVIIPWLTGWPDDLYGFKNWTSMATPHVAWLVSLAWMFRPDLEAQDIISAVVNSWDPLPSLDWKTVSWKRINAYNTLFALDEYVPTKPENLSPNWVILKEYSTPTFQRTESTDRWVWVGKYIFQLATSSSFDSSSLITEEEIDTNQLDYSISNINPTWTYYWRVKAIDIKWNIWDFSDTASFSYNIVPPEIIVSEPESWWKKSKTVSANITDNEVATTMWYAISDTNNCSSLNYIQNYTIWSSIPLDSESYNSKYVCFKAESDWWTAYGSSNVIDKIDITPPTEWDFTINGGATHTNNTSATLNVNCASDNNWIWSVQVAYGDSANPSNWTNCSTSNTNISYTLPSWDGSKTVYMKFRDGLWNITDDISKSIILDATAPILKFEDEVSATYVQNDTVTVDWWDATVKKYMYTTESTCPTTAGSYTDTTSTSFNQTTEINNSKYICLYAEDALWNASTKRSDNAIHIDITPPTEWSFTINNDATYSNSTSITLNTTCATDALDWNIQVAYGTSPNPHNWTTCSSSLAFDLSAPDWAKTVYMRFKDWAENTTTDISKSIILDATAPSLSADNSESWKASSFDITLSVSDVNGLNYSNYSRTSAEDCINSWTPFTNWTKISYSTEWTSTLYLCAKDNAWNTNAWNGAYKIDTVAPTISFDKESGAIAKNHSVIVTASDTTSKLADSQKISYKWSTTETCWTEWFTELAINPAAAGSENATATISTDWLSDWSYYLCILWWTVSDQAGNKNESASTNGVFIIDNTPPSLEIQYSAMNVCTNSDIIMGVIASDIGSWVPTDWYSRDNTSDWWDITEITLTENWNWTVYVKDNVWNIAQIQYNVDWIDKTVPTLEPINVTWPECTLLEWGVTVNDTLCWANNIVCNWSEFWAWTTTAIFPYKLMWIWTKTWIVMARDWAWNESSSVEVTYTWTDTLPTLEFPNYGYNTSITTTKSTKIWNIVQIMWAIDWDCWNWPEYINATSVSCTSWSWKLENNELFVYAPSGSEWISICTITFVDDEGNSITWNIAYNYNTKSTWWSWWGGGGWGWGWGWGGWGWSSSSSNSSEKSWIEKVIEMKNLIHEDDSVKWDSSIDKSEGKSDLTDNTSAEDLGHASYSDDSGEDDVINMDDNLINIKINNKSFWYMTWNQWELMPNWFSRELSNAYHFSYTNWITTMNSIYNANMNWLLSRIAMAKMLSIYAVNVLGKTPDTSKVPNFNDVNSKLDNDYNKWVTLAYQLWIMWQNMPNNLFRPYDLVTRAEFATALSRLLYWTKDWLDSYYSTHLNRLRNEWIISNTDPRMREVRWYVMLMLMRSAIK